MSEWGAQLLLLGAGASAGCRLTLFAARQDAVGELVHVLAPAAKGDSRGGVGAEGWEG